jgi:hypothetical protein
MGSWVLPSWRNNIAEPFTCEAGGLAKGRAAARSTLYRRAMQAGRKIRDNLER